MAIVAAMKWTQGDHLEIVIEVVNAAGLPDEIAGDTFQLVVRDQQTRAVVLNLSSGSGVEITDVDEAEVTATVTAEQTEAIEARQYDYAFRRTTAGAEATLTRGPLTVEPSAAVPAP